MEENLIFRSNLLGLTMQQQNISVLLNKTNKSMLRLEDQHSLIDKLSNLGLLPYSRDSLSIESVPGSFRLFSVGYVEPGVAKMLFYLSSARFNERRVRTQALIVRETAYAFVQFLGHMSFVAPSLYTHMHAR